MENLNGFDRIAFIYDFLAKLIFGKSIIKSQKYFLNRIQDNSRVLILGGGSGRYLAELIKVKPNCEVWYIEASARMILLTKNKINSGLIHYIYGTEKNIPSIKYDVVITNFYLDLFSDAQLEDIVNIIRLSAKPKSTWIVTDFVNDKIWWQTGMLRIMYLFFRITCGLKNQKLPQWNKLIMKAGIKEVESKTFYVGFIKTALFQF